MIVVSDTSPINNLAAINQLQARQFERVDLDNLLEELASMGRSEKRKIEK